MENSVNMTAVVNSAGRVLAAFILAEGKSGHNREVPGLELVAVDTQRLVKMEVPEALLRLRGPELHKFFAEVRIEWPATVHLPKLEIGRHHKE